MLFSKSFVRKTKKGSVIKVVQEHYLRDDIYCGVTGCLKCHQQQCRLPAMDGKRRFLVIDASVAYHQIDVVEHHAFECVILLQTVLDEIRRRSLPVYNRLRALAADDSRKFHVFCNEHHRETFVEKSAAETISDRNARAVRRAVEWYNSHLQSSTAVVLLSDSIAALNAAREASVTAFSLRHLVETSFSHVPELADMVCAIQDTPDEPVEPFAYPEHLSAAQMSAGLKSGAFHQGTLRISTFNFLQASVLCSIGKKDASVVIDGREHLNRAVEGDIVAVQLLPKTQWVADVSAVVEDGEEEEEFDDIKQVGELKPTGKVVGIIKRNWRPFCGTIDASSLSTVATTSTIQSVFFWAMDKRIPKIRVMTRQAQQLAGKRVVVSIDSWDKNSMYPNGHYVRTLGDVGDSATETQVLLLEHDVPFAPFSPLVLSCLPPEGEKWLVDDSVHLKGREDLRSLCVCSIDPPGCTDIDDALHCYSLPNGNYCVGVHIADVSHFVTPDNAMDLEAQRRGTTVYLVDKRIDMLPSLLGTNLCSLRSNVDRLAFSVIWEITPDAQIVDARFTKSVIRSQASLTYDEAQARLDDPSKTDPVSLGIKMLNSVAKKLRARRMEKGALTLASPEVRFNLEKDSQDPVDVEMKELKDTNALVEEFMLLANIQVARKIHEAFPEASLLRRHPKPNPQSFEGLQKAVEAFGFKIDPSTSKTLSETLDNATKKNDPYFNKLVRIMTTRCMMQAVYFCSGTVGTPEFWHYGLASDIYTHFTSPIRRYADLVVHRLLSVCIGYDTSLASSLVSKTHLKEICDVLNYRGRMAQLASRSSVQLYTNLFFKNKKVVEDAYVIGILKNGFSVLIPKYGVEAAVSYLLEETVEDSKKSKKSNRNSQAVTAKPFKIHKQIQAVVVNGDENNLVKLFDKVLVQVTVEEAGVAAAQRSRLVVRLVAKSDPRPSPSKKLKTGK